MIKFLAILAALIPAFILGGGRTAELTRIASPTPTPDTASINLSKVNILLPCICDGKPLGSEVENRGKTNVSVNVPDAANKNFKYEVTGGRILGEGSNAVWDFNSGAPPGNYSITVSVDDRSGNRTKTLSQTVTVAEPCCMCPCECPSITVRSNHESARPGEVIEFSVDVFGGNLPKGRFAWNILGGEILQGEGTNSVRVQADQKADQLIAEVDIGPPDVSCNCPTTAERSVRIVNR